MRALRHAPALGLFLILLTAASSSIAPSALADGFSNADLDGDYGYSLRGTTVDAFNRPLELTAIGQMTVSDGVSVRHTRTFNIGGVALVDGVLFGQAEVSPDGRGVVVFCGENTVRSPGNLPFFPRKTLEVFDFVLTGRNSDVILVQINRFEPLLDDFDIANCPAPSEVAPGPVSGGVLLATVRRQDVPGDDDD